MANTKSKAFKMWLADADSLVKNAGVKVAADQAALSMSDPTDKGTVAIPDCGDGSNRALNGLPANSNNMDAPNKEHNIMDVTKPNGVGQGEYIVPKDGSAADRAVTSPTTPLSKLAQSLQALNAATANVQDATAKAQDTAATVQDTAANTQDDTTVKQAAPAAPAPAAAPEFNLPASIAGDSTLMAKLASLGSIMMGCEEGQRAVQAVLEKRAGIEEARAIWAEAQAALEKEAAANYEFQNMNNTRENELLVKQAAAARQAHATWFNQFNTEMEKEAYAHGAEDGDAMADAIEGGVDPETMADVSDEEALEYIQALVESGQISQEEAEAIITALGNSMQDGLTGQELADALTQAVDSGELTPEQATAIAQEYMARFAGGEAGAEAGAEEAAMAAAAEDPAVQEAAAEAAEKTAAVINHLWTPGMA